MRDWSAGEQGDPHYPLGVRVGGGGEEGGHLADVGGASVDD